MSPQPPAARPGCVVLLALFVVEVAAAVAFGWLAHAAAVDLFAVSATNAVPLALLLSPIGAFIVDRFVKRWLGWSLMRAVVEPFAGWP